ncbi:MAG: T9SS type A sorting domain-containing protein [Bacteroidota bacterium]|nr:T9SS type A sorting domain-containing protein [Bacteroidota bacterium]
MIKKLLFIFSALVFIGTAQSQILKVSAGTDMTILAGTNFSADGLTLTPSATFTLTNTTLSKSATAIHTPINTYISRVYQFSSNSNPYSGSVQINYTDGAELNGIAENALTLNIYNRTNWGAYAATTRDATNNFVLTTGLSSVTLNELTLADLAAPLPLAWLSFTAIKQNQTVLLQWATVQEQNTKNFTLQHSNDGIGWTDIDIQPAAGNSSSASLYSYVDKSPITGINYYRIMQTDRDNKYSYSEIRSLRFSATDEPFTIMMANPVTNGILTVQVNLATGLALYNANGKLLWKQQVNAGIKNIDVSRYAKGIYLIKANSTIQKIVIQ